MSEFPQHNERRQHGHGPGHELVAAAGTGGNRLGIEVRLGQSQSVTEPRAKDLLEKLSQETSSAPSGES